MQINVRYFQKRREREQIRIRSQPRTILQAQVDHQLVTHKPIAAAKIPPATITTPVGSDRAGASPVLFGEAGDGEPVCEAAAEGAPLAITTATVCSAPKLKISAFPREVVLTPSPALPTTYPLCVSVQTRSPDAIMPLQSMSIVHAPGVGSVRWNSHVEGPCLRVYGSQNE
jgi:hypothetical protein